MDTTTKPINKRETFYEHIGVDASSLDPMILMITLADLKASLE